MKILLRVDGIYKSYPGFSLENVTFSLNRGRIMGLIGKNGAGKSTTLKSILNMVQPQRGNVTMFEKDFYQNEKGVWESKPKFWFAKMNAIFGYMWDKIVEFFSWN